MEARFYGLRPMDVRSIVYRFCVKNGIKHTFSEQKQQCTAHAHIRNPAPIMGTVANTFERYNLTNRCNKFMLFTQIYLTQLFLHLLLKKIDR